MLGTLSKKVVVFAFLIGLVHGVRKTVPVSTDVAASAAESDAPPVMVESCRLCAHQNVVKTIPNLISLKLLYNFQQNLIPIFILIHLQYQVRLEDFLQYMTDVFFLMHPVRIQTFVHDIC